MSDLERIGDDLAAVLRRLGLPPIGALQRLADDWAGPAGETRAARARAPGELQKGPLNWPFVLGGRQF